MSNSFNEQFDEHGAWRREFAQRLTLLTGWLKDHDLVDAAVEERLRRLEAQVRSDKVLIAFIAEFSRGKSELINAIFFAGYRRRIMPASAGRTTMCPTELGYDPEIPPCLRLLPIETRLQPQPLMEWRGAPEKWTRIDLDVNDPAQLAQAFEQVAEVRRVTNEEARALGFWHDERPEDNPMVGHDCLVEVPRWRHALINIAHPLLKQGLVILDTPGLNAIGAEPELTVNLIPHANAVVFMLAADTGVTKSELAIWREYLATEADSASSRLVVLNKIDTLWDSRSLSTPRQVQAQIERQRALSAEILGLAPEQVLPVSAQKGLAAKVEGDDALLQESRLPTVEQALADGLMGRRQRILRWAVAGDAGELREEAARVIDVRRRDLAEQMQELKGLRGKNESVVRHMRARIEKEKVDFDASGPRINALRSVHLKQLRDLMEMLGTATLKSEMGRLGDALRQPGIKLGVSKAYEQTFERLREGLRAAQAQSAEIQSMLTGSFRQLNAEYGFALHAPAEPDLVRYERDLDWIERSHNQYLSIGNVFRLAQPQFADRLVRALTTQLRAVYDTALNEVELWNKSAAAQLDTQLRERRRNFARRRDALDRIEQAASGLEERIAEIEQQDATLDSLDLKLIELTYRLVQMPEPRPAETLAAALDKTTA